MSLFCSYLQWRYNKVLLYSRNLTVLIYLYSIVYCHWFSAKIKLYCHLVWGLYDPIEYWHNAWSGITPSSLRQHSILKFTQYLRTRKLLPKMKSASHRAFSLNPVLTFSFEWFTSIILSNRGLSIQVWFKWKLKQCISMKWGSTLPCNFVYCLKQNFIEKFLNF